MMWANLEYAEKAHLFLEETPMVDDLQKDERTLLAVVRALEVIWRSAWGQMLAC